MTGGNRTFLIVLAVVAALGAVAVKGRPAGPDASRPSGATRPLRLTDAQRNATFTFAPDVAAADRTAIATAISGARPEAQRLVDAVDGLVDLSVVQTEAGSVGTTQRIGDRYDMRLNLALAEQAGGQRGIARLVLHELGHVVDDALVPRTLRDRLVAEIPNGYGCEDGVTGGCTAPEERFAETFAKWATNDIGVDIYLGYRVPAPGDLSAWGAPLAQLPA